MERTGIKKYMLELKFKKGIQEEYDSLTTKDNNTLYFCTDTKRIFKGAELYSKEVVFLDEGKTTADIPSSEIISNILYITTAGIISSYNGTEWKVLYDPSSIVQSDFEQTDSTQSDYVKNRPIYTYTYDFLKDLDPHPDTIDFLDGTHNVGDIVTYFANNNYKAILKFTIQSLLYNKSGYYLRLNYSTLDSRTKKDVSNSFLLNEVNCINESIGEDNCKTRIRMLSKDVFDVFIITNLNTLSDEYKTTFTAIGMYIKYIALPSYASSYYKVYFTMSYFSKLNHSYLDYLPEEKANKDLELTSSASDSNYPSSKAVYDFVNNKISESDEVYILKENETIEDAPSSAKIVYDTNEDNGSSSGSGIDVTSASVGDIVKIKEVDATGKPLKWEAIRDPNNWEVIRTIDIADGTAETTTLTIDKDDNGKAFSLIKARLFIRFPAYTGSSTIPSWSFSMLNKYITGNKSPLPYTSVYPKILTSGNSGVVWEIDLSGTMQHEKVIRSGNNTWGNEIYGMSNVTPVEYWAAKRIETITSIGGSAMLIYPGCHIELHGVRA